MDETKAAAYYDELKAKGAGAKQFRHGLGFGGNPAPASSAPQAEATAPAPATAPPTQPTAAPAAPRPPPAGAFPPPPAGPWQPQQQLHHQFPPRPAHPGYPPAPYPYAPPPGPPIPGFYPAPHSAGPTPPSGAHVPPPVPPAGVPLPGHPGGLRPPGPFPYGAPPGMPPMPPGPYGLRPPGVRPMFSGMPPPGVYPGAVLPESRPPLPIHPNAAAEAAAARNLPNIDEDELEAAAAAIEAEAAAAEVDAAKRRADEAEQARLRSKAWTAHKSAEGQVYYHNSLTGESSWDKPAGFTGSADVVGDVPVPIARANVVGTPWFEVKCSDGRRYYFNNDTQETEWIMPVEVARVKKKQADEAAAAHEKARQAAAEQRAFAQRQMQQAAGANHATVAAKGGGWYNVAGGGQQADAFRRMHMQRLMEQRQQEAQLSREVRVQKFKQLLVDSGVNAFSFYAKVKSKLEKDERWKLLPNDGERRSVFDEFCKNVAEEQKALAAATEKQAVEGFKALLEEALQLERQLYVALLADSLDQQEEGESEAGGKGKLAKMLQGGPPGGTAVPDPEEIPEDALELTMEQLEKYWANDDRWAATKPAQRAAMFQARFGAAAEAAAQRRAERRKQLEADYQTLFVELGVTADSSWSREVRDAVRRAIQQQQQDEAGQHDGTEGVDMQNEQQQQQQEDEGLVKSDSDHQQGDAADGAEQHSSADVAGDSTQDKQRESRGKKQGAKEREQQQKRKPMVSAASAAAAAALEESDREALFRRYVGELAKQRQRQHASEREQHERQAAAEARMAEQQAEAESRQRRAARSDANSAFNTLLSELVREPIADFDFWLPKLKKDPLKRANNALLTEVDMQRLFDEHITALTKSVAAGIQAALHQHLQPRLPSPLQAAAALLVNTNSSSKSAADASAAEAAAEAWRRAGGDGLPDEFRRFQAVDDLLTDSNEERWMKVSEKLRLAGWRSWVDEVVWGKPPPPPAAAAGTRAAAAAEARGLPPGPGQGADSRAERARYGGGARSDAYRDPQPRGGREYARDRGRDEFADRGDGRQEGPGRGGRADGRGSRDGRDSARVEEPTSRDRDNWDRDREHRDRDREYRDRERYRERKHEERGYRDRDRDRDRDGGRSMNSSSRDRSRYDEDERDRKRSRES